MRDVLVVFLKAPREGEVKSRLGRGIGEGLAARLYRRLAEETLRATAPREGEYARVVYHTPASAAAEVEAWLPGEELCPQGQGDLGERMREALLEVLGKGADRAAVIGTDALLLTRLHVLEAFEGLLTHDLVLGPSIDGGYYLLATASPPLALFHGMPWSTPSVLDETLARAKDLRLSVHLLPPLPDIDTVEDLRRFWSETESFLATDRGLLDEARKACLKAREP